MFNKIPQEVLDKYIKTIINIERTRYINPLEKRAEVIKVLDEERKDLHNQILNHIKTDRNDKNIELKLAQYLADLT